MPYRSPRGALGCARLGACLIASADRDSSVEGLTGAVAPANSVSGAAAARGWAEEFLMPLPARFMSTAMRTVKHIPTARIAVNLLNSGF